MAQQAQSGSDRNGIIGRAGITLVGGAVGGALLLVNEILCARYLGVQAYGLYGLAVVLARIGETLSVLGLRVAAIHYLAIFINRRQIPQVYGTIIASLLPPVVIGSGLAVLTWLLAPLLAKVAFSNPSAAPFIRVLGIAIPFLALSEVTGVITRGYGKAAYYVMIRNLIPPVAFIILLLTIRHLELQALWVAISFGIAYLLATIAGLLSVARVGGAALFRVRPVLPFKNLYTYSLPILLNTMLYMVIGWTDILMLGVMRPEEAVGIYRACMQIVMPFDLVIIAFNSSVAHIYPVLEAGNRPEELARTFGAATRWMTVMALCGLLVIGLNRHDLLQLMGQAFVRGDSALMVLAIGRAAACAVGNAGFLLVISGRQKIETRNAAYAAVVNLLLNALLIPRFGTLGAALSTMVSLLLLSGLRVVQVRKLMGLVTLRQEFLKLLLIAAATAGLLIVGVSLLDIGAGSGLQHMVIRILATIGIFFSLIWFFGLSRDDQRSARLRLHNLLGRARGSV